MFKKWDYINQKCECHLGGSGKKKLQSHAIKKKDVTFHFFFLHKNDPYSC